MRIISRSMIRQFEQRHPEAASALDHWYRIMKSAEVHSFAELRDIFSSADMVGKFTVFNIGGNKYRLIAHIHFNTNTLYIRHVLTHDEYQKDRWKE